MPKSIELNTDEDEDSMDVSDVPNETMNVEFEGRLADDSDFEGIKMLLQQLFLQCKINISEVANSIISHNHIGCVIHQIIPDDDEDDDDDDDDDDDGNGPVLGVITILNLSSNKNESFENGLKTFLSDKCSKIDQINYNKLKNLLIAPENKIGWLLNEKLILHPHLSFPCFKSLWADLEKAKTKNNSTCNFDYYIMIAKTTALSSKKHNHQIEFTNPEDKIFYQNAWLTFTYDVEHDSQMHMASKSAKQHLSTRTVIVFQHSTISTIMQQMENIGI